MGTWGIARAKAQLSDVVYQAEKTGPQTLTRSGREVAVIVSIDEWKRMGATRAERECAESSPGQSMAEFLMNSPLHGLKLPKIRSHVRNPFR